MRARLAAAVLVIVGFSDAVAGAQPREAKVAALRTLVAKTGATGDELPASRDESPAEMTFVRAGQGFRDASGGEWVRRTGKGDARDADRLGNELAIASIYRLAEPAFGTAAPETRLARIDGQSMVLARKVAADDGRALTDEQLRRFGDGFVIDAWLANWDVGSAWRLGTDGAGRTLRASGGGGLFLAKGDAKGAAFGETVTELQSMRDPLKPASFAFRRLGDRQVKEQLARFAAWYPKNKAAVDAAIDASSLGKTAAAELKTKLAARAQWLVKQAKK